MNITLFSHVKRSLLLWLHMKIAPFDAFREMILYFIGVYMINRILNGRLEIRNFSSRVAKYLTCLEENFVSPRGHVISSIHYLRTI